MSSVGTTQGPVNEPHEFTIAFHAKSPVPKSTILSSMTRSLVDAVSAGLIMLLAVGATGLAIAPEFAQLADQSICFMRQLFGF